MKVGEEKISHQQQDLLNRVESDPGSFELYRALSLLMNDDDIASDREALHPKWLHLFEVKKSGIKTRTTQDAFVRITRFFADSAPFDPSVEQLDPNLSRIAFVLGAGASKPEPSGIPTVRELLPHLLDRGRRLDREDVTKLADFCDEQKIDNIEDLLTAAELATFCSKNAYVLRLMNFLLRHRVHSVEIAEYSHGPRMVREFGRLVERDNERGGSRFADVSSVAFLQDTLQVLFGLLASTMLPAQPNPAHESIAKYASEQSGTSVVTTNYDCCMDLALDNLKQGCNYHVRFSKTRHETREGGDGVSLVKLHGSLNWYYCETCQEVQEADLRKLIEQFTTDEIPYPVIGICKECGGQRRGLLVPPLAIKFDVAPPLTPLLERAKEIFDNADLIVVVGFSFAEADQYISRVLSKSMQNKKTQRLMIVDPQTSVVTRIRNKLKRGIPGFDEARVLRVRGDCSDVLPKFLTGQLKKDGRAAASG